MSIYIYVFCTYTCVSIYIYMYFIHIIYIHHMYMYVNIYKKTQYNIVYTSFQKPTTKSSMNLLECVLYRM